METILKAGDLKGGYGDADVIKGISFEAGKREFIAMIGPNGSGKSTLLRLLTKAIRPSAGKALYSGRDIARMRPDEFAREVAFVCQDTTINFAYTVEEIVFMGRIPHCGRVRKDGKPDQDIVTESLRLTDSEHLRSRDINGISAGERQRVLIAKALAQEPSLLFLDEPTSHLDIGHQTCILDMLKRLNGHGLTIIIVLHDLNLASEYANRILLMRDGIIHADGTPEEVLTYHNIETVYNTVVVVRHNPISKKPYIIPISGEVICRRS